MMKKRCLLLLLLLSLLLAQSVSAVEEDYYTFELRINGSDTAEVAVGDVVTVQLWLRLEDATELYTMYGMQAELRYDSRFLKLVEGGTSHPGVVTSDIQADEHLREYYMNFLSMGGGTSWEPNTLIGTVQFQVVGDSGVTKITNEDFLVSRPDGSKSICTTNELLLILSTDCTVTFRTSGGSELDPVIVQFGEKLPRPQDPVREGYRLAGWYRDIHLQEEWNFDTDVVESNMVLYAKWVESEAVQPAQPDPPKDTSLVWWLLLVLLLLTAAYIWWDKNKKKP